ncbi:unnamed protein product, partial [Ectocarpus sp. 12 AP-2014]
QSDLYAPFERLSPPIDADGKGLDFLVQPGRNARAAKRFLNQLIARFGQPCIVIPDKLRSYIKPIRALAPDEDHRAHKGLNKAIEVSHRPTRQQKKIAGRFKSPRQARRSLSAHGQINLIFRSHRHKLSATEYRQSRSDALGLWAEYAVEMTS